MKMEGLEILKSSEQITEEKKMREDAQNQFRLAVKLYSRTHGMRDFEGEDFGEAVWTFWTDKDDQGESYSKKYIEFIESANFKEDSRFRGEISLIELDDFI
jgi:hypothetical protein